ncbi:caspase family protein [Streptomyces cinerochromogenes]|uniref:Caspase family protein n=1 Tax=Streptomyces cinerochromogenes TaxID=66422 RepID=A0ABW7B7H5_9ACTN
MYRALIVCNSRFPGGPGALHELQGPKADGLLLRDALTDPTAGLFQRSEVRLVAEADAGEIIAAVDEFFSTAEADDTLLFYYSGHGRNRNRQLFLCAGNTRTDRLRSTALPAATLSDAITDSFAQVKIVILDCCHSGGFKGDDGLLDALSGEGRYVIAATSEADRAADAEVRGEPSPFTRALVDGLLTEAVDRNADHVVDLDDLFTYLAQVKFDGHAPHRTFDGAGAVPIARRPVPTTEQPAASPSLPEQREQPGHRADDRQAKAGSASMDDFAPGETLSEKLIEAFRRDLRDDMAAALPEQLTSGEFLQRAGLLKDGHPTLAGVLLFGQNPTALLPSAMVRCVRFRGTRKTDPVDSVDLHGTVPELIVRARDFVAKSAALGESPTAASAYSEPAYRYPMIAVREIIANAVVHRDYTDQAACVQVHVFDDRIEVISPGTWSGPSPRPDGQVRLSALEGQSQPRNFRLARLLTWVKLVESVGAGLPRSVADCQTVGSPEPVVVIRHGMIMVTLFPTAPSQARESAPPARAEADAVSSRHPDPARSSRHLDPARIAEVLTRGSGGSGYRVTNDCVLTAAHALRDDAEIRVRLTFGREEWAGPATVAWVDATADVALLRFEPPSHAPVVPPVRYGRITGRPAVVTVEAAGFPAYKRRADWQSGRTITDLAHLFGTASTLSNLRSGTLEITVNGAPSEPTDGGPSPWAGMGGAPVWAEGRIVGVINAVNPFDGPGHLEAVRIERLLTDSPEHQERLAALLGLGPSDKLPEIPSPEPERVAPYTDHIRALAPAVLHDRETELAELAAFCQGDEPYALWQGAPWSGKTALFAAFALRPPSGVDVVAFFATHRLAGHADSMAFTDSLIEQLAWLLDEPVPAATMYSGARDQLRSRLLGRASARARAEGRRLLLLVDGLDEDRGPQTGLPSIASLLPQQADEGLRVLVAGRRTLLPDDVPAGHPLRHCRVRMLKPSSVARDVSREAFNELYTALTANQDNQDVIGLIAANPAGITRADLARLTGQAPYRLETILRGGIGRLLTVDEDRGPADPRLRFAHEEFRTTAVKHLGPRLMAMYEEGLEDRSREFRQ